jgi:membrane associated rhomboid family serine protease
MFPIRDSVSRTSDPIVVWTIIGLNIAVFFYQLGMSAPELNAFLYQHALVPRRYFSPGWANMVGLSPTDFSPFLTNTFLHGGWLHIIFNMWTLYIFGLLYLLAGVAASATHALFNAASTLPALGASGAIAGVIAAYAVRFPYAWVRILVPIVFIPLFFSIPAIAFAGIWFFMQLIQGASELFSPFQLGAGIAWWAHIGGFVAGWVLVSALDPSAATRLGQPGWYNGGPWESSGRR